MTQGQQIRLKGQGNPGQGGGPNGDLYLDVQIEPHSHYHLDGRDVSINFTRHTLGSCFGRKRRDSYFRR